MNVHDEVQYECEICDMPFTKEHLFKVHMLDKHFLDIYANIHDSKSEKAKESTVENELDDLSASKEIITDLIGLVDSDILTKHMTDENQSILKIVCAPLKRPHSPESHSTDCEAHNPSNNKNILLSGVKALVDIDDYESNKEKFSKQYCRKFQNILNQKKIQRENKSDAIQEKRSKEQIEKDFLTIMEMTENNMTVDEASEQSFNEYDGDLDEILYGNIEPDDQTFEEKINEVLETYKASGKIYPSEYDKRVETKIYKVKDIPETLEMAKFECNMCDGLNTESYQTLLLHMNLHFESIARKKPLQKLQKCPICSYILPRNFILEHITLHLNHTRCFVCHHMIHDDEFELHHQSHSEHHSCSVCGEVYQSIHAIRKHGCHHRKGVRFMCSFCNQEFAGLEKMVHHISFVHFSIDIDFAKCPFCLELTDDIKNHCYSVDKCKFKCKVCLMVFKAKSEFQDHMKLHFDGNMARPIKVPVGLEKLTCNICKRQSTKKVLFEQHKKAHLLFEKYKGLIPLQKESKNASLSNSQVIQRQKRVECKECHLILPFNAYENHLRNHRIMKLCPICLVYIFHTKFENHMETLHSPDNVELKCDICGENRFDSVQNLDDHIWCHTRTVQRPCGYCKLMFSSELSRVKHVSLVHKSIEPNYAECYHCFELIGPEITSHLFEPRYCLFRCKICNARHSTLSEYETHLKKIHSIEI